jgi:hypothetical protein
MQMPLDPCEGLQDCVREETSISLLRSVFGSVIDHLITGEDPVASAAQTEILPSMIGYFNGGLAIVGGLLLLGIMTIGVANSANDGEVFGKNWNSVWTPLRAVAGMGMLLPTSAGFSFAQLFVLMVALWGVGLANGAYKIGIQTGILAPESMVQGINHPGAFYGMRAFAQQYVFASYCARTANDVFKSAWSTPNVSINLNARDDRVRAGNEHYDVYEFKDRGNKALLAGKAPICGELRLMSAAPMANVHGTDGNMDLYRTIQQIRNQAYTVKLGALKNLMGNLDAWVAEWPANADQPGWDKVTSRRFNDIVRQADTEVVNGLRGQGENAEQQINSVTENIVQDITRSGWAEAGGWFQKVGQIRTTLVNITSAPIASLERTSKNVTDEKDPRQRLFNRSVAMSVSVLLKAFRAEGEDVDEISAGPVKFDNIFDGIGTNSDKSPDATGFKRMLTDKMSTTSDRWMKWVTEMATGANGDGTTSEDNAEMFCGDNGRIGGAINRMKCVGDAVAASRLGLYILDASLKTGAFLGRLGSALVGWIPGANEVAKQGAESFWDWVLAVPAYHIKLAGQYMEPVAFMFGVVLPSMPYMIFLIVIVGWLLGVLQTVLAIPLWALLHMTPEQTFVGSQRQGYLMLLSLLVRPALAIIGLFAAILVSDPLVTFVVNGFFAIREAVEGGDAGYMSYLSALPMFLWWMIALSFLLIPVLQMCFGLPQILPGAVLQWIGAGISDLGESGATGKLQSGLAANNVPENKLGQIQRKRLDDKRKEKARESVGSGSGQTDGSQAISGVQGVSPGDRGAR